MLRSADELVPTFKPFVVVAIHLAFGNDTSPWIGAQQSSPLHCAVGIPWHKASLPPPPHGGTARHGTKQGGTRRFRPPPPYSYHARPYAEQALRDDHYGVPVAYIWAQCICFLVSGPMLAFLGGPWVDIVASWWSLDGHWCFLVVF